MSSRQFEMSNLAFLASMASLAIACDPADDKPQGPLLPPTNATTGVSAGDDGGDEDGGREDDGGATTAVDEGDDDGDGTFGEPPGEDDGGSGLDTDGGFESDDGAVDDDSGFDEGGSGGGQTGQACQQYGDFLAGCYMDESYAEYAAMLCEMTLQEAGMISPQCAAAEEQWFVCVSALTCRQWQAEEDPCAQIDFSPCADGKKPGG